MQAIRHLLSRVASADVTMHEIEGGAHELFIGLEREKVTDYILQWIDKQLTADTLSEASERMTKSRSLVSVTGNPFEWRPTGMSPAGSIYGTRWKGASFKAKAKKLSSCTMQSREHQEGARTL